MILLDIMIPVLNGYKVCQTLREEGNWTPILMLTAKDGEWDQVEALDTGADDYVTKPFSFDVLLARMRSLLRRGVVERPVQLVVGDLVLDPATKDVSRGGQSVRLTARELSLLEFLMRRAGDVVTKTQILANVWDNDFEGDPNIVEVYIARLREQDRPAVRPRRHRDPAGHGLPAAPARMTAGGSDSVAAGAGGSARSACGSPLAAPGGWSRP